MIVRRGRRVCATKAMSERPALKSVQACPPTKSVVAMAFLSTTESTIEWTKVATGAKSISQPCVAVKLDSSVQLARANAPGTTLVRFAMAKVTVTLCLASVCAEGDTRARNARFGAQALSPTQRLATFRSAVVMVSVVARVPKPHVPASMVGPKSRIAAVNAR